MLMKSKLYLILGLGLLAGSASAQNSTETPRDPKHEFSVYGKGGISTLQYRLDEGTRKNGFGGGAGLGYTWFFAPRWGLQTGLEFNFYRAEARLNDGTELRQLIFEDNTGDIPVHQTFRSRVSNFKEQQRASYLNIPLMVQYRTAGRHQFYAALGVKAGFRLSSKFETTADLNNSLVFSGTNSDGIWEEEMNEQDPDLYTGSYPGSRFEGNTDLKFAALGAMEAGVKWRLSDGMKLYTGLYADIGLNSVKKVSGSGKVMDYTPGGETPEYPMGRPAYFAMNSTIASNEYTKRVIPLAFGVKIGLTFGKPKSRPLPAVAPPVPVPAKPAAVVENADSIQRAREAKQQELARLKAEEQAALARKQAQEQQVIQQRAQAEQLLLEPLDGFGLDKHILTGEQEDKLDDKAALLTKYPDLKLILSGHTCNYGSSAYNMKLGFRRAESVRGYLVKKGVAPGRLRIESRGEEQPLVPNEGEQSRLHNRRVEFRIDK